MEKYNTFRLYTYIIYNVCLYRPLSEKKYTCTDIYNQHQHIDIICKST